MTEPPRPDDSTLSPAETALPPTAPASTAPASTAPAPTASEQPTVTPVITVTAPTFWQRTRALAIAAWRRLYAFLRIGFVQNAILTVVGVILGVWWATPAPPPPEIEALIHAEAQWALASPRTAAVIDAYTELFADDASISDATTNKSDSDTYAWVSKQEIEQRFLTLQTFEMLKHELLSDIRLSSSDTRAWAITSTNFRIAGQRPHKSFEEWTFIKVDGRWKISTLTFNLPFNLPR